MRTTKLAKSIERREVEPQISPIEELIREIAAGKMVVLVDDEDRENEGDLVMAAEAITAEALTFMITHGRGLVCMPLTKSRADDLALSPMVEQNEDDFGTAFTVSIDATSQHGVTTGISAQDRAKTIALAAKNGLATDFNRPGHVFPLIAREGGVLERNGHTEAAVELARLGGYSPMGVIVEIIGDSGEMIRFPELTAWAERHRLKISTIEKLRDYLVRRQASR